MAKLRNTLGDRTSNVWLMGPRAFSPDVARDSAALALLVARSFVPADPRHSNRLQGYVATIKAALDAHAKIVLEDRENLGDLVG